MLLDLAMLGVPRDEDLYQRINELAEFQRYVPGASLTKPFKSPLRADRHPSMNLFYHRTGRLLYKDMSTGDCGDLIKFVSVYHAESRDAAKLRLMHGVDFITPMTRRHEIIKRDVPAKEMSVETRHLTLSELRYWRMYGLTIRDLTLHGIKAVKAYSRGNLSVKCAEYTFLMLEPNDTFRIYKPFDSEYKWIGTVNGNTIFNPEALIGEGPLVITKSKKDVMVLASLGIRAIAFASESTLPTDDILESIRTNNPDIIILYDDDQTGRRYAELLRQKIGGIVIFLPTPFKDISDWRAFTGESATRELLIQLLKKK